MSPLGLLGAVTRGSHGGQYRDTANDHGTKDVSIDSLHIDQDVNSDGSSTVTVTIPQSGTLEFYCKYHRSQGMAGELKAA